MKVVVCKASRAGLGDRLKSLTQGLAYATSNGWGISVDWRDGMYSGVGINSFDHFFQLKEIPAIDPSCVTGTIAPQIWNSKLHLSVSQLVEDELQWNWDRVEALRKFSADLACVSHQEDVLVVWDCDQMQTVLNSSLGLWQRNSLWPELFLIRKMLTRHLRFEKDLKDEVEDFAEKKFIRPTIGVHVRSVINDGRNVDLGRFVEHVESILARHPQAGIFLATDSVETEDFFRARFSKVITKGKKEDPGLTRIIIESAPADRKQCLKEAVIDMILLSKCNYLLFPEASSFSSVSAALSGLPLWRLFPLNSHTKWQPTLSRMLKILTFPIRRCSRF